MSSPEHADPIDRRPLQPLPQTQESIAVGPQQPAPQQASPTRRQPPPSHDIGHGSGRGLLQASSSFRRLAPAPSTGRGGPAPTGIPRASTTGRLSAIFRTHREDLTPEGRRARERRETASREHRVQRRHGEQPSATPPSEAFLTQRQSLPPQQQEQDLALAAAAGDGPGDDEGWFECEICGCRRSNRLRSNEQPTMCCYCASVDQDPWGRDALAICPRCLQEFPQVEFEPYEEEVRDYCRRCWRQDGDAEDANDDGYTPGSGGRLSSNFSITPQPLGRRGPLPGAVSLRHQPPEYEAPNVASPHMLRAEPPFDNNLDAPAIHPDDAQLIKNAEARLLAESEMELCPRCKHKWFDMQLHADGVCHLCHNADDNKGPGMPDFYSSENSMHLGYVPDDLPELTQTEEQLIARVHIFIDVKLIRGQQYKYSKHCVSFLRDTGSLFSQLPRLPKEVDIIVLRPKKISNNAHAIRTFRREMTVRRAVVEKWLRFLIQNHPGYRDLQIDYERLAQLPEDGDVGDQVTILDVDDVEPQAMEQALSGEGAQEVDDEDDAFEEVAAAPNTIGAHADLHRLRAQLAGGGQENPEQPPVRAVPREGANAPARNFIELPGIRSTPLIDFNQRVALISLAMPSLMPRAEGEFTNPRPRECSWKKWLQHALMHEDGRFATHSRFLFVAFNTYMRAEVNKKSNYFVSKPGATTFNTIDELKDALADDSPRAQAIINSIVRSSDKLKGTRPFWNNARNELQAQCHALKCPHIFLTFSAADLHWESLARVMPGYEEWKTADDNGKRKIAMKNLKDNPQIAAWHFYRRFKIFFEEYLTPKFGIVAWWFRFEWQGRGSTHCHGLYWLGGAGAGGPPTPPNEGFVEQLQKDEFLNFWGLHVQAWNPEPGRQLPPQEDNPLKAVMGEDVTFSLLSRIANRVQKHNCTEAYCLRKFKGMDGRMSDKKVCRFYYERLCHETAVLTKKLSADGVKDPPWEVYDGARNDGRINNYARGVLLGWMANIDSAPCTSLRAVINYIAKYCSKAETQTQPYKDMMRELIPKVSHAKPMVSLVAKTMNKLLAERDWPAMEVAHHLFDLPLVESSHVFVRVDCRHPDRLQQQAMVEGEELREYQLKYGKYCTRPDNLEDATFFDFLTRIEHGGKKDRWHYLTANAKPRIPVYFPRYKSERDSDQYEDFARMKLTLNHPHRSVDELYVVEDAPFATYAEAYAACKEVHEGMHDDDFYGETAPEAEEEGFEEEPQAEQEALNDADWQVLAGQLPNRDPDTEDIELLGNREIDRAYDWSPHVGKYPELWGQSRTYWKDRRAENPLPEEEPLELSLGAVDKLNAQQRLMHDTIVGH